MHKKLIYKGKLKCLSNTLLNEREQIKVGWKMYYKNIEKGCNDGT